MFSNKVLRLVKQIPKGKVTTYKEIGKALHKKGRVYMAVGRALHENKSLVKIPCHRVVCSDGSIGGYSHGIKRKIALLKREGIEIKGNKILSFERSLFRF